MLDLGASVPSLGFAEKALEQDKDLTIRLVNIKGFVHFEGLVDGHPVDFKAQWSSWDMVFVRVGDSATSPQQGALLRLAGSYDPDGKGVGASKMPVSVACVLLCAGVMAFRLEILRRQENGEAWL